MESRLLFLLLLPIVASNMVNLEVEHFGTYRDEQVKKFTWTTESGFSVSVISYGVTIQSVQVPDNKGVLADVVLGFDDLQGYVERNTPYLGATIGRCANRIAGAAFDIDGVHYTLAKNVGNDHLHGGIVGFDKVNWKSSVEGKKVFFSYLSKDGEEGYPGDLLTTVSIEVKNDDTIRMVFQAMTSKKTVVNLTNHAYFNLAGHETGAEELYNHCVSLNANKITETDSNSIPTGKLLNVEGTPFDLRDKPSGIRTRIGDVINKRDNLFDDNFCISTGRNKYAVLHANMSLELDYVATVTHPSSRYLDVYSDQPGVQFYTSNFLPSPDEPALVGKSGKGYRRHGAFCLETQKYPDAVHHDNFPSVLLSPGEVYKHQVVYKFGAITVNDKPCALM